MGDDSLDADYFDAIFRGDEDPWGLASNAYEAAKFDRTIAAVAGRRYARALEVGCAHGVLTGRLAALCDDLLAVDISAAAVAQARCRVGAMPNVRLETLAFPGEPPAIVDPELTVLSEVVYYWNDTDIARAAAWLADAMPAGGRVLLVHWTGETDYPQTGDAAVDKLRAGIGPGWTIERADRTDKYRLDLWCRR